ncbi:MAG: hypothetical protein JWL77_1408, partial [Chthonomonadaceae bacterium]|nr:hypothetical protein [Chthonomonadaceae bacterium]
TVESVARWYDMELEAVEEAVDYEMTLKAA